MTEERIITPESIKDALNSKFKWYQYPEIWFYRYIKNPIDSILQGIKYFFQRGARGYSDEDRWNFDLTISTLILEFLVWFKAEAHTVIPTRNKHGKLEDNEERSKQYIDEMIEGFALANKCSRGEELHYGGFVVTKYKEKVNNIYKTRGIRLTTKEEDAKIKRAFELFHKCFFYLND